MLWAGGPPAIAHATEAEIVQTENQIITSDVCRPAWFLDVAGRTC